MIQELKQHYCNKAADTNNILFDINNCLELIEHYRTTEPNAEKVTKWLDRIKKDMEEISKTHQQEYYAFEMMHYLCLSEGCE